MSESPKRPYELEIEVGADNLEAMANSLELVVYDIRNMIRGDKTRSYPHTVQSVSPDYRSEFRLFRTDTADHDEYMNKLEVWLDENRKDRTDE